MSSYIAPCVTDCCIVLSVQSSSVVMTSPMRNEFLKKTADTNRNTGKITAFPDAEHIQETYCKFQMYCSIDSHCTHDVSCINFQYCTDPISSIMSWYRTNDISSVYPYPTVHMVCNVPIHIYQIDGL